MFIIDNFEILEHTSLRWSINRFCHQDSYTPKKPASFIMKQAFSIVFRNSQIFRGCRCRLNRLRSSLHIVVQAVIHVVVQVGVVQVGVVQVVVIVQVVVQVVVIVVVGVVVHVVHLRVLRLIVIESAELVKT